MGVKVTREVEIDIYCIDCGEALIICREEDYGNTVNIYVNQCLGCNRVDVSDVV